MVTEPALPRSGSTEIGRSRNLTFVLCLVATVLGFASMVQSAAAVIVGWLGATPERLGIVVRFGLAGLTPTAAAIAAWLVGGQEPDRTVRVFRTAVVTLIAEVLVLGWFAAHGFSLNGPWL